MDRRDNSESAAATTGEDVEFPRRETGRGEGARADAGQPERDPPQSRHHLERSDVDVGQTLPPHLDQCVHLIGAVRVLSRHTPTLPMLPAQRRLPDRFDDAAAHARAIREAGRVDLRRDPE